MNSYTRAVKTAVSLPDELFHRAEREAARRGVSRSALYAEALALLVVDVEPDPVTAALDRVYADVPVPESHGVTAVQGWVVDGSWSW